MQSGKSKHVHGQKRQTYSTKDAQDAFITFCDTEEGYKENLDCKIQRESSVPPFITIIGSVFDPKTILCDFENITYKFSSLPKAIDVAFKTYHLFNLEYATAARHMWQFINNYFYKIKDTENAHPTIHVLLKKLQGNL